MSNSQSASAPLIRLPYSSTRRVYRKGKLLFDNKNNNNILDYNGWAFSLSRRQRHTSHPAPHTVLQLNNLTLIHVMDAFLTNEESSYKYKRTSGEQWTPCLPPYNPTATPPSPPIQPVMRCLSWNQRTVLFWFSCFFFILALLSHSGLVPPRWQLIFFLFAGCPMASVPDQLVPIQRYRPRTTYCWQRLPTHGPLWCQIACQQVYQFCR